MPLPLEEQVELGKRWECIGEFKSTLHCLEQNHESISKCQESYRNLHACTQKVEGNGSFFERLEKHIFHNRFLTDSDSFGREEGALSKGLQKIAPQVFDGDAGRKPTKLTSTLQEKFPKIFADDDDDDDE